MFKPIRKIKNGQNFSSDKIFRVTKVTKFSDRDGNFVQPKILSDENFVRHCFVR